MACNVQLRLLALKTIRCLPRSDIYFIGQRHFVRCICPVGHNLIPMNNKSVLSVNYQQFRCKWKRKGQQNTEEESDSDDEKDTSETLSKESSEDLEPGTKIICYKTDSIRVDKLVRKALNISVKKMEDLFYDKKVRVNDDVLIKKSQPMEEGDIITVPLQDTPGNTVLGAVIEVLEIKEGENGFVIKIARNKNTRVAV